MEIFVNRESELSLIDEAVTTLIERQRLLKTPIIEFYGFQGIGKTMLLRKIKQTCDSRKLAYFWVDINQNTTSHYMQATKDLLSKRQPVVIILDSLDKLNVVDLRDIESGLIYFNAPTTGAEIHLPFGGMKASGNGHRELGPGAVEEFSETKSIFVSYPLSW